MILRAYLITTPLCTAITNSPKFSLHWTAFGNYNPSDPDPDNDGIPTVEEILLYHTNPNMPDTDLDGISDGDEVASGFNPLSRDTDGDGLVDGSDPDPLSVTSLDDLDGDGIPDTYEIFMFGSTNAVNSLAYDPNGTGFPLPTKIAAGMDPAAVAAEETSPTNNLASLKLFDGFRCDFTNTQNTLYSRTFNIDRDGGWQQYFISSAPDKAEPWKLDGMTLEWSDSGGGSGTVTTSPQGDSFYLPVSTNSPANLTLTLRSTSPNSICSQPLYLLTWSPAIEASGAAQATIDGSVCYAVEWQDESGSIGIQYDLSNRPCHAEPTELELAARLTPFPGETRLVFTPTILAGGAGATGGMLSSKAPGAFAIPSAIQMAETKTSSSQPLDTLRTMRSASTRGGDGDDGGFFIFFDPEISYGNGHSGGCGSTLLFDTGTATYSKTYEYPLNSGCLWRSWRREASGSYSCNCKAIITYGDESLKDYFTEIIVDNGTHATGTILFGGNAIWQGEAWHHTDDGGCVESGVEQLSSDGCDACSSGCADGNCDDLEGDSLNSLAFRIPLGMPRDGQVSGFLWFRSDEPLTITPSIFNLLLRDDASISSNTVGTVRTLTCNDERGRTAVIESIANGVRITLTKTADSSLEHTWVITNENGSPNQVRLHKISRLNNDMRDVTYTYADGDWVVFDNIAQSSEQIIRTDGLNDPESGILHEERIVRNASNAILSHATTDSRRYGFGESAVIREIYHSTLGIGEDRIEDYATYWEDNENTRRNGRPRLIWGESRAWSYQTHDTEGRELLRLDQLDGSEVPFGLDNNTPPDFHEVSCVSWLSSLSLTAIATVSDYTPLPSDSSHLDDLDTVRTESRYLVRNGAPTLIGRTWRIYSHDADALGRSNVTLQTIRAGSQESTIGDPSNAVSTETHFDTDAPNIPLLLRGRSISSTDEDGTITTYEYALGTWDDVEQAFLPVVNGAHLRTLVSRSTAAAPNGIPGKSTQSLNIQDATHGTTLYTATLLGSTGDVLSWQSNTYDDKNRLRSTQYSDGSSTTNAYSCCRLLWWIDRNGAKTLRSAETGKDHLYYAMEEVSLADLPGGGNGHRITQHFMDALGRGTNTVVTTVIAPRSANVPDCETTGPRGVETMTYPDGTSDYAVHTDRRGVRTVTMNRAFADREESVALTYHPTNLAVHVLTSTNVIWRNGRSASLQSWAGGWTREISLSDYNPDGTRCAISIGEASDSTGSITNRITHADFLGRAIASLAPGANGCWLVTSNAYDGATSRLIRSETTGRPAETYLYDALGESVATVQSGITSTSENQYEMIGGEVWQVAVRSSSSDGVTNAVSTTRRQMTGLSNAVRSRSVSVAASGSTTTEESAFDPLTQELTLTRVVDAATPAVSISKFGRTVRRQSLREAVYNYFDSLGRVYYSETRHPVTNEFLYDRWSEFDEAGNEVYHDAFYGDLFVTGSKTFDVFNQETTRTDALGNAVTSAYDALGRTVVTSGATYPVRYEFDTMGRMKELSTTRDSAAWDTTQWRYDHTTGLTTNKVYADNSVIGYTYIDDGKPLRTTWARGAWREYDYNGDGLLTATAYSDATPSVSFGYDAFQHLASASNTVAAYTYANDNLGAATNEIATIGTSAHTLAREYDGLHRSATLTTADETVHYSYDNESRLSIVSNAVFTATCAYTPDGLDAGYAVTLTNEIVLTRALTRDTYRRQLVTAISNTVDNVVVNPLAYSYDLLNRAINRNTDSFGYNARSEVASASILSNAYTFVYDFIGNHTASSVNSVETIYTANNLNQYSQISVPSVPSVENPSHDLDGNMLTNGVWSYSYDAENRLTAAFSNRVCVVSNAYDYMSRRIQKITPTVTRTFIYDGWKLIQETVAAASGTVTNHYVWGKDLSGSLQGAGGVGGLLAVKQDNAWYFPCYDANGNITAYIDESGAVVAEYTYDAFGSTIDQSGSLAVTFRHRFSTKYYDSETGLYYYGLRFYSPSFHRWLNRDPIEEMDGFNVYGFGGNDGVNNIDLFGLAKLLVYSVGDSLTLAEGVRSGDDSFDGYAVELLKLLKDKFPQHTFERTELGAPGAGFKQVLAEKLDKKYGDRNSTSKKLSDCEGVIVPFLFGINSLARDSSHTYGEIKQAAAQSYNAWLNLRDGVVASLPTNKKAIMIPMTIPSLSNIEGSRFNQNLPAWNVSISLLNGSILFAGPPTRSGLTYSTLTLAQKIKKESFQSGGISHQYDLYSIGGHIPDGLHFDSKGNDYISKKVFEKIQPWVRQNFK